MLRISTVGGTNPGLMRNVLKLKMTLEMTWRNISLKVTALAFSGSRRLKQTAKKSIDKQKKQYQMNQSEELLAAGEKISMLLAEYNRRGKNVFPDASIPEHTLVLLFKNKFNNLLQTVKLSVASF